MIGVDDWAEIRRLHRAEGCSIKEISRRLGVARNTVRSALRSERPPRYERRGRGSMVDAVEPALRELLAAHPRMPATVIAERIGWSHSLTVLKDRIRELRPLYVPPDPCQRTEYRPGELAQWDLWFPDAKVPLGIDQAGGPPVLVGVSGYSRWLVAQMIPSRESHDLLCGHLSCLVDLGGVPRLGVYDGEGAIGRRREGRVVLTEAFQSFRGSLGMGAYVCKPRDPEAKGLVERGIRYLETSFLPGRAFEGPGDFNAQLAGWLERANRRVHRTLRCRPADRIVEDRAAMLAFPPVLPDPALRFEVRLGRDHYVRVGTCDYSVDPRGIGRRVEVRVDLNEVTVRLGADLLAGHVRSWAKHRTITDPAHERGRDALHRKAVEVFAAALGDDDVEIRDLSSYDRALGLR
ncbi:MAG TPA: IS21 family transposase [Acidimicrobiia bacterium]